MRNLLIDILIIITAFFLAFLVRANLPLSPLQPIGFYMPFLVAALVLYLVSAAYFRLYSGEDSFLSLSYFVAFLKALFLWLILLAAFGFFVKTDFSRAVVVLFFGFSVILLFAERVLIASMSRRNGGADERRLMGDAAEAAKRAAWDLGISSSSGRPSAPRPGESLYAAAKRAMDICVSLAGLLLLGFVMPAIAFAIRRDSHGPVIIKQDRIGLDGKRFRMYKFRTMYADTALYARSPRGEGDPRVTRAGAFLRRTSIDELPQLWNVLRGEMSIVGPRPEMPFIVERYAYWQTLRHSVKPGITGVWQIYGRKDLPLEQYIEYDIYYVVHRSFFLDVALILKTGAHLILPKGAY